MAKAEVKETPNVVLTFGRTTFNSKGLSGMTISEFKETYKSTLDVKAAAKVFKKYFKKAS